MKLPDWLQVCPAADYPATCALVWLAERSWPYLVFGWPLTRLPNRLLQSRAASWKTASCHHYVRTNDSGLNDAAAAAAAAMTTNNKYSDLLRDMSASSVRRILFPEPRSGCFTPVEIHTLESSLVPLKLVPLRWFWHWDLPWEYQRSFCRSATVIRTFGLATNILDNKPVKKKYFNNNGRC